MSVMSALLSALMTSGIRAALATVAGLLIGLGGAHGETIRPRPCDIYAAAHTPCVAAHSTVRALYDGYAGALYQVKRTSDGATENVGLLADGYANAAAQDKFCASTAASSPGSTTSRPGITTSPIAAGGHCEGPAPEGPTSAPPPTRFRSRPAVIRSTASSISPGMGYHNVRTTGVAVKGEPEGMYMVSSATHFNSGCCFDYGNAETSSTDTGAGHMDALNVSRDLEWPNCRNEPGHGVHADLENGIFHWDRQRSCNPAARISGGPRPFISAWLKNNGQSRFALKWGDAQSGGLNKIYAGALPRGYAPMRQEGAIILGIGGDNSHGSAGSFFEGAMTAGFPTDGADDAVQSQHTLPRAMARRAACPERWRRDRKSRCGRPPHAAPADSVRNQNGTAVIAPITSRSAAADRRDATWIVRRGLADNACVSFESKGSPGDFLRHQNAVLRMQPFDGTALNRSDATFCPEPGKKRQGNSFHAMNDPAKYIRHYYGKVYIAGDGDDKNPWDAKALWSDDASFVVGPPWSPVDRSANLC